MSDDHVTERARQIVTGAMFGLTTPMMVNAIVSDLDAAGLLATPERLKAAQIDYLSGKYPESIRKRDAAVAAKAWSEAVAAVAWAMDRGPDPLRYVAENNPYEREAGESGP